MSSCGRRVPGAGTIVQKIDYDEFGNQTVTVPGTPAFPTRAQPFGFAGGLYDEDTGLVHFGARDYDPVVGRWISKDPVLFGGKQANLYVYAGNDPVNRVDPSGLWDVFVWRAYGAPIAHAGPVGGEIESVAMTGYDSGKGVYHSEIGALGAHLGTPVTHAGIYYGADTTLSFTGSGPSVSIDGITMAEAVFSNFAVGGFRTSSAEWGMYSGFDLEVMGAKGSFGVGAAFPHWLQVWLESKWSSAKAICK